MKLKLYLAKRKQQIINKNLLIEVNRLTDEILRNPNKKNFPVLKKQSKLELHRDFILNEISKKLPVYKIVMARNNELKWALWISLAV